MSTDPHALGRAFRLVLAAYLVAAAVALFVGWAVPGSHPLVVAAWADLGATLAIFAFSVTFNNSSFYDIYWSVAPIPIALYFALHPSAQGDPLRRLLVVVLVTAWGARLTWNWVRTWQGLGHEDWRYVGMREKSGPLYWLVSLTGLHLFPTVMVFLGLVPVQLAAGQGGARFGALDLVAASVTGTAIAIEALADQELYLFRKRARPGEVLESGLWRWSRHPNYLGEMGFWWGLALFALAAGASPIWSVAGALAITVMFVLYSIPALDRRMLARRPRYAERMKRVPALIPRPWRRDPE